MFPSICQTNYISLRFLVITFLIMRVCVYVQSKLNVGTVFHQLEDLKLCILREDWSKVLVWLLRNSPKLRVLNLYTDVSFSCLLFS